MGMFMFLFSSLLLPTFYFPFTLLYFILTHFISVHSPFMRVTFMAHVFPLFVHILVLSLHVTSEITNIEYSEYVTVVTMLVTLYRCDYWKKKLTHAETFPFVFVPIPFHVYSHSFPAFLFSCQFHFTSLHVPSISVNHIFFLRSSY